MNKAVNTLALRYAQAVLATIAPKLTTDGAIMCMQAGKHLANVRQWLSVLALPGVSAKQKNEILAYIKKDLQLPPMIDALINVLYLHRRMEILPDVLLAITRLFFIQHAIIFFQINSMPALNSTQQKQFRDFLEHITKKHVRCTFAENAQLLAGIRAKSDTLLWEYSVAKKLREAQQMIDKGMI